VGSQEADLVGESIGNIRIIEVLGHGGMGTVYLGEDEKLRRKVAVKAIRGEHRLNARAKARFLREARILSQINHRNICAVHEFVEREDSDYLVLELVPGRSLRAAMKTQLSVHQKMSISKQLLEVLVAVHGAGVIHRDLKPENIMVRPDGQIAVLDFGLARSVDEDVGGYPGLSTLDLAELESQAETLAEDQAEPGGERGGWSTLVRTTHGMVIGSAGYMSPEQARAEPATAASDMYSVGLIFQELFTGAPPFDRDLGSQGLVIQAAEGETRPVTGLGADLTRLVERLKALAPGARPSSVDALAELRRVIDRPKRHRKQMIVAAVWLVLAGLAAGMTIQSLRASREAERANREAAAAQEVSDFLVGLFEESNPEQARGASLSAEEILQRGADRIDEELADQPLTRARLLMTIGSVYYGMGLYTEAASFVEQALDLRRAEHGEEHPEVAESTSILGLYHRKLNLYDRGEDLLLQALELNERLHGPDHLEVASSAQNLGILYSEQQRFEESKAQLERALAIYDAQLGPDSVESSKCLANLAVLEARQGRVAEAEPLFRRVLEIQRKELGADHPEVAGATNNLATALKILGRHEEAEALFFEVLEIQERVLGPDHPDLRNPLGNLANLYMVMQREDEAEPLYLRTLEIARTSFGPNHHQVARALGNLGQLYLVLEEPDKAEATCLEALAILEETVPPEHPDIGMNTFNLAGVAKLQGRPTKAEERYKSALAIYRGAFGHGHPRRIMVAGELAGFLREQGRDQEAAELEAAEGVS
jgi:serine/threonine protein kinase